MTLPHRHRDAFVTRLSGKPAVVAEMRQEEARRCSRTGGARAAAGGRIRAMGADPPGGKLVDFRRAQANWSARRRLQRTARTTTDASP